MNHKLSRNSTLIAGTLMLLCFGIIYAWSIYSAPLGEEFGFAGSVLGLCFTTIMICFCLGGMLGSSIAKRLGVKKTIMLGGVICCIGYGCVSLLKGSAALPLFLCFGLSGLGGGVVYNAVVSTVVSNFPDKKGFASGILLMGFGASTLVFGSLASFAMESSLGWRMTYVATGVILFLAAFIGSNFIVSTETAGSEQNASGMPTSQVIRSADFWLYFCTAAFLSLFGQAVIGNARTMSLECGAAASLATLSVGLTSAANGLGRIIFGSINDKKGYGAALLLDAAIYMTAGIVMSFAVKNSLSGLGTVCLILCGFAYGAVPPITSSVSREFFGSAYYAKNYSLMNLHIIPASFGSALMSGIRESAGSFTPALWLFAAIEILPIALILVLQKTRSGRSK